MKIGIDLRPLYTGSRFRGIGTYTLEVLRELLKLDKENEYHFLNLYGAFPEDLPLDSRCFIHSYYQGPTVTDVGERSLFRIPELEAVREAQVRHFLQQSGIELMLFTSPNEYGNPFRAEWFSTVRTAAILYDVIPLAFPQQCLFDERYRKDYEDSLDFLKGMDRLFAISEFTREDVIRRLEIPGEKILTVSSGIHERYLKAGKRDISGTKEKFSIPGDYFLFAGGVDFKKNIESVIRAFAILDRKSRTGMKLVVAGKMAKDLQDHYLQEAESCGIRAEMVFTGYISDEELLDLYTGAEALVFPSLYEGFGLPVIEAMACGTPVITSGNSSLKEIAEGYAQIIHPEKTEEIARAMDNVLRKDDSVQQLAKKALPHAREFTWQRVAQRIYAGLKGLASEIREKPAPAVLPFTATEEEMDAIAHAYSEAGLPMSPEEAGRIGRELSALERGDATPVFPCGTRILYDFTVVSGWMKAGYVTGIGRVSTQLYRALRHFAQVIPVCTLHQRGKLCFFRVNPDNWETGEETEARSGDVYFMPEYQVRGVQLPADYPPVSTLKKQGIRPYGMLYDILPLLFPQYFEQKTAEEFGPYLQELLANYDGLITDSRTVVDETAAWAESHPEFRPAHPVRMGWIHLGSHSAANKGGTEPVPEQVKAFFEAPTCLMVGTIEPRKGHEIVLNQFEKAWAAGSDMRLCVIGHCGWNMESFIRRMKGHPENYRRLMFLEAASDSILNYAYRHAAALIQASAGEGFGLPLIEAGEYGVPLLCSDIPVFHEVAGDHALYFNRENDDLSQLILDFDPEKLPSSEGMEGFTWERAACRVANMLLCGAEWYRELQPDGTAPAAAAAEARFALCPEEPEEDAEAFSESARPARRTKTGEKSLLIVFPNHFLRGGQGTNNRVKGIVRQLKKAGWQIDQLGLDHFSPEADFTDFEKDNTEGLIRNLYLFDMQKESQYPYRGKKKLPQNQVLMDWTRPGMHTVLQQIADRNGYTAIATFYTYFANLFATVQTDAKKIYFMEDCVFMQQASWGMEKDVTLGRLMDEELEKLKLFDEIFCISWDEKTMYEKLTGRTIHFLPHLMPGGTPVVSTPVEGRKYDVGFVGFNNPFNVEGMNWFAEEVCPLLDPEIRVVLVGSMTTELKHKPACVTLIPFAPSLEELFDDVKINICPMFRGTGMKIKVVEAMARGLPTVCNDRGVDGFPDKTRTGCLVTQDPAEFAAYINRLAKDPDFYRQKREETMSYYRELFDMQKYVSMMDKVLSAGSKG